MAVQKRSLLFNVNQTNDDIKQLIKRRRRQIMVHSAIYYRLGTSVITDAQFDKWARELVKLQNDYPNESKQVELYEDFKDWDASSGFNLNFYPFLRLAQYLVKLCEGKNEYQEI